MYCNSILFFMDLKWNIKPKKIKNLVNNFIKKSEKNFKNLNEKNIKDFLQDHIMETINLLGYISFFQYVSTDKNLRKYSLSYENKLSNYILKFSMSNKIFDLLNKYKKNNNLKNEDLKFVNKIIDVIQI